MGKKIFLLSDQVIHWNIIQESAVKMVYLEQWGNRSINRYMDFITAYFTENDMPLDWSLLDNGMDIHISGDINPTNNAYNHVFASWSQFSENRKKVWRIKEIEHVGQSAEDTKSTLNFESLEQADLLLIQDWGMKIRELKLPDVRRSNPDLWIIYRPYPPFLDSNLWRTTHLTLGHNDVLVLRADDLRLLDVFISKGLSWEQTLQDIIKEIYCSLNIALHSLRNATYVIISFGLTGTLLIHNPKSQEASSPDIHFFFDPTGVEGYWEICHPGYLPGSLEMLLVLLAKEILHPLNHGKIDFAHAIRAHLLGSRALHMAGGKVSEGSINLSCLPEELDQVYRGKTTAAFTPVALDFEQFMCMQQPEQHGQTRTFRDWSLLSKTKWDLYSLARQISIFGPKKALQGLNIPIAEYNYLFTVDRKEIEFLRNLQSLFTEYLLKKNNQPLSIAVFGSPGSGKSFSIKQLAKSLGLPDQELQAITFNLSQFNVDHPHDLYQAFHAVRDILLSGRTPLVFWDEFDSNNLAWLRYFLAPMEDGEFQEGQLIHNIGKSVFVFAGGTCASMEQFEEKAQKAVAEKGPDFLSRIKGFINIMGPNPILPYAQAKLDCQTQEEETAQFILAKNTDPEYIIRRAILLNSLLRIGYGDLFINGELQIDDGVLNAFLMVPKYKHGSRSMQTIFKTSQLYGKGKYNRSDLPPQSQLNLHVDGELFYDLMSQTPLYLQGGEAFYHLVNEVDLDEAEIKRMATGIHAIYSLVFSTGKVEDPLTITKEEFVAFYEQLQTLPEGMPHDEVSQNYHNARKIPQKLAAVGIAVVPLDSREPAVTLNQEEFEIVSRLEHIRWVRHHIDNGWCYAPIKNKALKQHDALIAWDDEERKIVNEVYGRCYALKMGNGEGNVLDEYYRNLDRVITMAIPWILESVGYKMVRADNK